MHVYSMQHVHVYLVASAYEALGELVDVILYTSHVGVEEIRYHTTREGGRGRGINDLLVKIYSLTRCCAFCLPSDLRSELS